MIPGAVQADDWQHRVGRQVRFSTQGWYGFVFTDDARVADEALEGFRGGLPAGQEPVVVAPPLAEDPEDQALRLIAQLSAGEDTAGRYVWVQLGLPAGDEAQQWRRVVEVLFLRANAAREPIQNHLGAGVIFALPSDAKPLIKQAAPDLWSLGKLMFEYGGVTAAPAAAPTAKDGAVASGGVTIAGSPAVKGTRAQRAPGPGATARP